MKLLLVGKYSVIEPLGLLFLASVAKSKGIGADILLLGPQTPRINAQGYDLVGFSAYTGYHKEIFDQADGLRGKVPVIIGGPHATYFGKDCLPHADYVVVGEGLKALEKICDKEVESGTVFVPELVDGGKIPFPDRAPLYRAYREFYYNKIKNVMASFGCPWSCRYCYNDSYKKLYSDFVVRYRPVDEVVEECRRLKADYPLDLIFFQDDCFGFKIEWLRKFAERYRSKVKVPFHCQMRPETVTLERLRWLKYAGCHGVTIAIETYREDTRSELLGRKMNNKQITAACALIKGSGMKLRTEQMLGVPETSLEDELALLGLNVEIQPDIAWTSMYTPYLGTKLGDYCKERCLYNGNNDDLDDNFFSKSKLNFDPERLCRTNQLQTIFSTCSYLPDGHKLAGNFLKESDYGWGNWFKVMRKHLYDRKLYKVEGYCGE
jgi:radical SAM superfamily enzyme YgiQ (UPF0313 family)